VSNTTLTADIIAKEALMILEANLGFLKTIHRAYEEEFDQKVNGYEVGNTVSIRRPADFTIRSGAVVSLQNVIEGKVPLVVDQQKGVDFRFTSEELTLKIGELGERVIKPAITNLVHEVGRDVLSQMYQGFYNWLAVSGANIDSYADFAVGPQRLDEMCVPMEGRAAVLHPADHWGLLGSQTALFIQDAARGAYREASLGMIGGVDTYMAQIAPRHTVGTRDDTTPLTDGAAAVNVKTYDEVKNTWTQTLVTDGWDAGATLKAGDVFTIADTYMVNPRTKQATSILQQFVVVSDVTANANPANDTEITISPPIITSGPHQTVDAYADGKAIVNVGAASAIHRQNLFYHKNAMALAVVPMKMPQAVTGGSRRSYKGLSVRIIPGYDFTNDISSWRLDILYGRKLIDPRLGARVTATG
jgi:hypothetical protein